MPSVQCQHVLFMKESKQRTKTLEDKSLRVDQVKDLLKELKRKALWKEYSPSAPRIDSSDVDKQLQFSPEEQDQYDWTTCDYQSQGVYIGTLGGGGCGVAVQTMRQRESSDEPGALLGRSKDSKVPKGLSSSDLSREISEEAIFEERSLSYAVFYTGRPDPHGLVTGHCVVGEFSEPTTPNAMEVHLLSARDRGPRCSPGGYGC